MNHQEEQPTEQDRLRILGNKPLSNRVCKRIIVCCDGTWQDGIVQRHRWQFTNVIKLSRMIEHQDDRLSPPSPQIVFYQSGIGSEHNLYAEWIEGATGASLVEKVQEAYGFIAHNYQLGDEIFLFGFSRGAYTARMTAAMIGQIGVLDRVDMDNFADIFLNYQKLGRLSQDQYEEIAECNKFLAPWRSPKAKGRIRADADGDTFTVKCVGVFDTVGSLGLPKELRFSSHNETLFGFPDKKLGAHIQYAFHAMGLHETRANFDVAKYEQTTEGRNKSQVLKQVWFSGSHSDIGGGYQSHDLADITLTWMAANVESMLALNTDYLRSIAQPVSAWGAQLPHDSRTGIFKLSQTLHRSVPKGLKSDTHEYIHQSVTQQSQKIIAAEEGLVETPELIPPLLPLEERFKEWWPYVPGKYKPHDLEIEIQKENKGKSTGRRLLEILGLHELMEDESGRPRYGKTWLGKLYYKIFG